MAEESTLYDKAASVSAEVATRHDGSVAVPEMRSTLVPVFAQLDATDLEEPQKKLLEDLVLPGPIAGDGSDEDPWSATWGGTVDGALAGAVTRMVVDDQTESILQYNEEVARVQLKEGKEGKLEIEVTPAAPAEKENSLGAKTRRWTRRLVRKPADIETIEAAAERVAENGIELPVLNTEDGRDALANRVRKDFAGMRDDISRRGGISLDWQERIWHDVGLGLLAEGLRSEDPRTQKEQLALAVEAATIAKGLRGASDVLDSALISAPLMLALRDAKLRADLQAIYDGTITLDSVPAEVSKWYPGFKSQADAMYAAADAKAAAQRVYNKSMPPLYKYVEIFAGEPAPEGNSITVSDGTQLNTTGENGNIMFDLTELAIDIEGNGVQFAFSPHPEGRGGQHRRRELIERKKLE